MIAVQQQKINRAVLVSIFPQGGEEACLRSLDELKRLCEGLAEACGGQFTSMVAETQEVENNNLKQWEGRK